MEDRPLSATQSQGSIERAVTTPQGSLQGSRPTTPKSPKPGTPKKKKSKSTPSQSPVADLDDKERKKCVDDTCFTFFLYCKVHSHLKG